MKRTQNTENFQKYIRCLPDDDARHGNSSWLVGKITFINVKQLMKRGISAQEGPNL